MYLAFIDILCYAFFVTSLTLCVLLRQPWRYFAFREADYAAHHAKLAS